jgi:hypothetical protein
MEDKMLTLFWLGLIILSVSLVMLISGLIRLFIIIYYQHQRQQQCYWLPSNPDETKPQPCKKGDDEEELEMLTQLRKEGILTEKGFQREVKRIKFDRYWY